MSDSKTIFNIFIVVVEVEKIAISRSSRFEIMASKLSNNYNAIEFSAKSIFWI